jgi:hypothetical protein
MTTHYREAGKRHKVTTVTVKGDGATIRRCFDRSPFGVTLDGKMNQNSQDAVEQSDRTSAEDYNQTSVLFQPSTTIYNPTGSIGFTESQRG